MTLPAMFTDPGVASSAIGALGAALGAGPSNAYSGSISSNSYSPFILGDGNQLDGGGQGADAADLIGQTVGTVVPILVFGILIWAVLRILNK